MYFNAVKYSPATNKGIFFLLAQAWTYWKGVKQRQNLSGQDYAQYHRENFYSD